MVNAVSMLYACDFIPFDCRQQCGRHLAKKLWKNWKLAKPT